MKSTLPVCIVVTVALLFAGCAKERAVSSTMDDEEKTALEASLSNLEETLKDKSPFIFDKLAPAATVDELESLRSGLGGAQVECLEIWYGWHNGCQGPLTTILPLGRMLSIEEALADRKMTQSIPFVDAKRKSAFKILDDGFGDGYFLDIASESPRVFYHMLEDPYPGDYGTLEEFVSFIEEVHSAGIVSVSEDGFIDFEPARYDEIEEKYLEGLGTR